MQARKNFHRNHSRIVAILTVFTNISSSGFLILRCCQFRNSSIFAAFWRSFRGNQWSATLNLTATYRIMAILKIKIGIYPSHESATIILNCHAFVLKQLVIATGAHNLNQYWINVGSTLSRWINVGPTLIQRCVSIVWFYFMMIQCKYFAFLSR